MQFTTKNTKSENIEVATEILKSVGITNAQQIGYCESNGVSVYFSHPKLMDNCKIRVSDHGISNPARMATEICFQFDARIFGGEVKSKAAANQKISNYFNLD